MVNLDKITRIFKRLKITFWVLAILLLVVKIPMLVCCFIFMNKTDIFFGVLIGVYVIEIVQCITIITIFFMARIIQRKPRILNSYSEMLHFIDSAVTPFDLTILRCFSMIPNLIIIILMFSFSAIPLWLFIVFLLSVILPLIFITDYCKFGEGYSYCEKCKMYKKNLFVTVDSEISDWSYEEKYNITSDVSNTAGEIVGTISTPSTRTRYYYQTTYKCNNCGNITDKLHK